MADTSLSRALLLLRRVLTKVSSILPERWCCCGGELVTDSNVVASAGSTFELYKAIASLRL